MAASPTITLYEDLYDIAALGDDEIRVPESGVFVTKHLSELAGFQSFADLSDVTGVAGTGFWTKTGGGFVWTDASTIATASALASEASARAAADTSEASARAAADALLLPRVTHAGTVTDADVTSPADGDVGVNTTDGTLAYRSAGAWYGLTPAAQIPDYVIVSTASTAWAVDRTGAIVGKSSSRDSGAVAQTCLNAMKSSAGNAVGTLAYGPQQHDHKTVVNLPSVPNGTTPDPRWLTIKGPGAFGGGSSIKLASTALQWLNMPYTADYDTFTNIAIEDINLDGNTLIDASAISHVLLGNYVNSTWTQRGNYKHIRVRRCLVRNVPTGTNNVQGRQIISIVSRHLASGETQTVLDDIQIEDLYATGGNVGIALMGTGGASGTGVNVYHSNIHVIRGLHDANATPTSSGNADANIQIGGTGYGDNVTITGFVGKNSRDAGIEIDSIQHFVGEGCSITDAFNVKYLVRNFRAPIDVNGQRNVWSNCYARNVNVDRSSTTRSADFMIGGDTSTAGWIFGELIIHNAESSTETALANPAIRGLNVNAESVRFRRLAIDGFRASYPSIALTDVAVTPVLFSIRSSLSLCNYDLRNIQIVLAGSRSGTTGGNWSFLAIGGTNFYLDIESITFDCNGLTMTNNDTFYVVNLGLSTGGGGAFSSSSGTVHIAAVRSKNGPPNALWNAITAASDFTVNGNGVIERCDTSNLPSAAGHDYNFLGGSSQKAAITIRDIVTARTGVSGPLATGFTSISPGASPYDYQNLDSMAETVTVQGGTVSKIEYSQDGTNWVNLGTTAGAFRLLSGDHLRVTYSVAPTMWKARA